MKGHADETHPCLRCRCAAPTSRGSATAGARAVTIAPRVALDASDGVMMKAVGLILTFLGAGAGFVAAYQWYQSATVPAPPTARISSFIEGQDSRTPIDVWLTDVANKNKLLRGRPRQMQSRCCTIWARSTSSGSLRLGWVTGADPVGVGLLRHALAECGHKMACVIR
jgi:hypothetical protein